MAKSDVVTLNDAVIVLGAGGHAKVVIELLVASGQRVAYCIAGPGSPSHCMNVEVLIGDDHLQRLHGEGYRAAFPAVGSNAIRERIGLEAIRLGYRLINAISPQAMVSPSALLGHGVAIMCGVVINASTKIDDFAIINTGATVDHDCHIGAAAHVAPRCALAGVVTVGRQAFLGIGTVIIPGITIGEQATVGAGSTVVADIPPSVLAFGNPAKPKNRKSHQI